MKSSIKSRSSSILWPVEKKYRNGQCLKILGTMRKVPQLQKKLSSFFRYQFLHAEKLYWVWIVFEHYGVRTDQLPQELSEKPPHHQQKMLWRHIQGHLSNCNESKTARKWDFKWLDDCNDWTFSPTFRSGGSEQQKGKVGLVVWVHKRFIFDEYVALTSKDSSWDDKCSHWGTLYGN